MITTEIKANLTTIGTKFTVKFEMDITDHQAREITLAIASLFNDQPDSGEVIRTEKAKTSLKRQAEHDQADIFRDEILGEITPEEAGEAQPHQIEFTNATQIEYQQDEDDAENEVQNE